MKPLMVVYKQTQKRIYNLKNRFILLNNLKHKQGEEKALKHSYSLILLPPTDLDHSDK